VTLCVALALLLAAVSSQEAQQVGSMRSAVRVERVLVDAYVTTGSGEAIEALYSPSSSPDGKETSSRGRTIRTDAQAACAIESGLI